MDEIYSVASIKNAFINVTKMQDYIIRANTRYARCVQMLRSRKKKVIIRDNENIIVEGWKLLRNTVIIVENDILKFSFR